MRKLIVTLSVFAMFVLSFSNILAVATPTPTSKPMETKIEEVNSFELFWPMVAGKTKGDSLYFLKRLKENVRGWFIFAPALKSDYKVFLSVKRLLEAESLLKNDKKDLSKLTLQESEKMIDEATKLLDTAKKEEVSQVSGQMKSRLANIEKLTSYLIGKNQDLKSELESLKTKSTNLSSKL